MISIAFKYFIIFDNLIILLIFYIFIIFAFANMSFILTWQLHIPFYIVGSIWP